MAEREHVLSMDCWCRPVMDSYGSHRQLRYRCATGEHKYHRSPVQEQACQRLREAEISRQMNEVLCNAGNGSAVDA